ncbi:MAG: DJ-1/PfpI family protein [Algoriphagus sp.]|nr:DJ-1/PfpI family protein [Algoriphagus sp.]MBS4071007.1 DJ-1/PfpI family protein [Algoriphagus sp.]
MMKNLGIFAFNDMEVLDFAGPFEVFSVANQLSGYKLLKIRVASADKKTIIAKNGLEIKADFRLADLENLDYLVIPGGDGTKKVIQRKEVLNHIKRLTSQSSWTMSVCSGSRILGKTGFLDHKPYCTHHEVFDSMREIVPSGVPQRDLRFVQSDQHIWTAAGISAGIDLALHLSELTFGKALAEQTAAYMEYYPYLAKK